MAPGEELPLAFEAAVDRGAVLGTDKVIVLATGPETASASARDSKADADASPLTPRERQIAGCLEVKVDAVAVAS